MSYETGDDIPAPPEELGAAGQRLWDAVTREYELRPDELQVLASACALADVIDSLRADMVGQPTTVLGSAKQLVIHPILAEIRAARTAQAALLKQLRLESPDDDDFPTDRKLTRSEAGRKAARARWSR